MTKRLKIATIQFKIIALLFLVLMALSASSQTPISSMEYFIDSDPGFGNGTAITITPGVDQNVDISISTTGLSIGFHELVVRSMHSDGTWGIHETRKFYVSQSSLSSASNVNEMEYFFDMDPGYGGGTALTITSGQSIDTDELISTATLSSGFHELVVRARDSNGEWGLHASRVFYIDGSTSTAANANLVGIEYFIDADPGIGMGTEIAINPAQPSIDQDITLATNTLPNGNYSVSMRVFNGDGLYSLTETSSFQICTGANTNFSATTVCVGEATEFTDLSTATQAGDVYSWDFDSDGNIDDMTAGNTSFTYADAGTYTATLSIDRGGCAVSSEVVVTVETVPTANAGSDQTITADNTTLVASPAPTGETGTWSLVSGAGTFGDVNDPATALTGISVGQTVVRWTVANDVASCSAFDEVTITRSNALSTETDILTFSLQEQSSPAEIDLTNHTVSILVELGTNLSSLSPDVTVSSGASISPQGAQDFSSAFTYTVTAEDQVTVQDWVVTVMERPLGLGDEVNIMIYPNPVVDKLTISGISKDYHIRLSDLTGKIILEGENIKELSMVEYEEGTYLLAITIDGRTQSVRIIRSN